MSAEGTHEVARSKRRWEEGPSARSLDPEGPIDFYFKEHGKNSDLFCTVLFNRLTVLD